jgi:TIR domain
MDSDSNQKSGRSRQQRTDVFISYSHKDHKLLGELNIMLQPLVRLGTITTWDDTKISPGAKWRKEINTALGSARVAVLLVSPEFLASEFITRVELPKLLRAAERDGLTVLWVAVKHSLYRLTAIAHYQAANDPAKPLTALSRSNRDKELLRICDKIEQATTTKPVRKTPARVPRKAVGSSVPPRRVEAEIHSGPTQNDPREYLINFEAERDLFKKMLDDSARKHLMFIQAPGGRGKSSLLLMLGVHCEREGIPYCSIDSKVQPYDNPHLTLAQAMCAQLGHSPRHLAQALQPLSVYRSQGEIDDPYVVSQILAGVNITHDGLRQRYIKDRLRDAFIADLGQLVTQRGQVVCLFDSLERLSPEEEDWLLDTLLTPIRSRQLKGVRIVTAGHRWPKINKKTWGRNTYLVDGLSSMNAEHIKNYAEKLNIKITDEEAKYYWKASAGIPLHMAMVVRNLRTQSVVA